MFTFRKLSTQDARKIVLGWISPRLLSGHRDPTTARAAILPSINQFIQHALGTPVRELLSLVTPKRVVHGPPGRETPKPRAVHMPQRFISLNRFLGDPLSTKPQRFRRGSSVIDSLGRMPRMPGVIK